MSTPYEHLPLEEILERIRSHRWWRGEVRVVGILANWQKGRAYSAAVFRSAVMARACLESDMCTDAGTAREAALELLGMLDHNLAVTVAKLRTRRDDEVAKTNRAIEELTGTPEAVGAPS